MTAETALRDVIDAIRSDFHKAGKHSLAGPVSRPPTRTPVKFKAA